MTQKGTTGANSTGRRVAEQTKIDAPNLGLEPLNFIYVRSPEKLRDRTHIQSVLGPTWPLQISRESGKQRVASKYEAKRGHQTEQTSIPAASSAVIAVHVVWLVLQDVAFSLVPFMYLL